VSRNSESDSVVEDELNRRHRTAQLSVLGMFAFTVVLMLVAAAYLFSSLGRPAPFSELVPGANRPLPYDPTLVGALWISIIFFGLGAVVFRRTKFSAMRLQAVASVRGASGLLKTLQKTTILIALIGGAIAVMGLTVTLMTGEAEFMFYSVVIAWVVLLYAYPRRSAWLRVLQAALKGEVDDASSAKGTFA
jgi:hypothetical protein